MFDNYGCFLGPWGPHDFSEALMRAAMRFGDPRGVPTGSWSFWGGALRRSRGPGETADQYDDDAPDPPPPDLYVDASDKGRRNLNAGAIID